jgi:16S rRNA (adenine1518-N6/adenine1519-N6)-dimethyltransferase
MKLSEVKRVLSEKVLRPTKSLGQNFLHDGNQLRRIVSAADLKPGDQVLEVGPGLGALTEVLLASGVRVLAIEKDRRLVEWLQERFSDQPLLTLMHADALDYLQAAQRDWVSWRLVANLPYSVASPIIVELAKGGQGPRAMVVTLQLEVAQRLVAKPATEAYGILTLLVQLYYQSAGFFKIPSTCFFPPPDIDSACVKLVRRSTELLRADLGGVFERIVKRSFSQRRKMMLKLLREDWPADRLASAFQALSLPPTIRAEQASLDQFVQLTNLLAREEPPK